MSKNVVKLVERAQQDPIAVLEEVLDQMKKASNEVGDRAEEALEDAIRVITRAARDLAEDVQVESARTVKKAGKAIKARPVTTAAVAATAVALAGVMLARKARAHSAR